MSLVLYDNPISSNAMKVRFLLAELELDYERRHVPIARPRPADYVARYPFGTIPFLEDGDLALGESNAMLRYLANREGRSALTDIARDHRCHSCSTTTRSRRTR
jgi:glutathione S-transferase